MNRRYRVVAAAGVRTIDMFNRVPLLSGGPEAPASADGLHRSRMPYLLGVFDGLTGLSGRWLLEPVVELCQLSRAIGIHLVMATDDVRLETLPGLLLASIPARFSFRQALSFDSAIVLGAPASEELTEPGEALFAGRHGRRDRSDADRF
jgi:DNA segregation ATPase FtsK/SpoIIIE, S-DNA-T family